MEEDQFRFVVKLCIITIDFILWVSAPKHINQQSWTKKMGYIIYAELNKQHKYIFNAIFRAQRRSCPNQACHHPYQNWP